jgi:hypothetical protein
LRRFSAAVAAGYCVRFALVHSFSGTKFTLSN